MARMDGSSSTIRMSRRLSGSSGRDKVGFKPLIAMLEAFGQHFCFTHHGHEVGVAMPARHHMYMEVVWYPCAGGLARFIPTLKPSGPYARCNASTLRWVRRIISC